MCSVKKMKGFTGGYCMTEHIDFQFSFESDNVDIALVWQCGLFAAR